MPNVQQIIDDNIRAEVIDVSCEIREAHQRIKDLENQLASYEGERDRRQEGIENFDQMVAEVQGEIAECKSTRQQKVAELDDLLQGIRGVARGASA